MGSTPHTTTSSIDGPPFRLVDKHEAARMLGISASTIVRMATDGVLPAYRVHTGGTLDRLRFSVADVVACAYRRGGAE